ncbi:hypothetical protein GN244_ATG07122 [Phytophthora infestans]|uniref:Uncharacterized protein n=1 Tax=Phytophthora infestans TaxID=4787 RepID=A0A833SYB0_PHYIN|nr:hypothetical protein GN244_ATG07122 [Phytophthora infestans]
MVNVWFFSEMEAAMAPNHRRVSPTKFAATSRYIRCSYLLALDLVLYAAQPRVHRNGVIDSLELRGLQLFQLFLPLNYVRHWLLHARRLLLSWWLYWPLRGATGGCYACLPAATSATSSSSAPRPLDPALLSDAGGRSPPPLLSLPIMTSMSPWFVDVRPVVTRMSALVATKPLPSPVSKMDTSSGFDFF